MKHWREKCRGRKIYIYIYIPSTCLCAWCSESVMYSSKSFVINTIPSNFTLSYHTDSSPGQCDKDSSYTICIHLTQTVGSEENNAVNSSVFLYFFFSPTFAPLFLTSFPLCLSISLSPSMPISPFPLLNESL